MNTAIIVAAGSGKRFGGETPKQFLEIHGKPVLIYTLERFEECDLIDEIVLVLSSDEIEMFNGILSNYLIKKFNRLVVGGETRAESVLNGLNAIDPESAEVVAVHDGARPLVSVEEISQTLKKADETGAACLVAEMNDTVKEVSSGRIVQTIDRAKLRRALTPQCFRYEILVRAFDEKEINEITTDECFLVEQMGVEIAVVEGSSRNIKITHKDDLKIAEVLLDGN